ncbi:hypothetical protein B0H13DRAFT_2302204 [Mycena leptocephala]|nr:hypothetical protein B0H13DRAFT_2302204 [Mycena leptocephala]
MTKDASAIDQDPKVLSTSDQEGLSTESANSISQPGTVCRIEAISPVNGDAPDSGLPCDDLSPDSNVSQTKLNMQIDGPDDDSGKNVPDDCVASHCPTNTQLPSSADVRTGKSRPPTEFSFHDSFDEQETSFLTPQNVWDLLHVGDDDWHESLLLKVANGLRAPSLAPSRPTKRLCYDADDVRQNLDQSSSPEHKAVHDYTPPPLWDHTYTVQIQSRSSQRNSLDSSLFDAVSYTAPSQDLSSIGSSNLIDTGITSGRNVYIKDEGLGTLAGSSSTLLPAPFVPGVDEAGGKWLCLPFLVGKRVDVKVLPRTGKQTSKRQLQAAGGVSFIELHSVLKPDDLKNRKTLAVSMGQYGEVVKIEPKWLVPARTTRHLPQVVEDICISRSCSRVIILGPDVMGDVSHIGEYGLTRGSAIGPDTGGFVNVLFVREDVRSPTTESVYHVNSLCRSFNVDGKATKATMFL